MFRSGAPYASIRFSFHKTTNEEKLVKKVLMMQKAGYHVGIWGIGHPDMAERNKDLAAVCLRKGIDYREKEYLDENHGSYRYPKAVSGRKCGRVNCYPSEMLFAPDGQLYHCHHFLYMGVRHDSPECRDFGLCSPCDIKEKVDRLQHKGHCAVTIEEA